MTGKQKIRIGGASGYWGDSNEAPRQLVEKGNIDFLVFDYLAEVTMSILVRAKQKDPEAGYAKDFVFSVMKPLLADIKAKGIRVVVNSGGVNVGACAEALRGVAEAAGIELKIATVSGDDVLPLVSGFADRGTKEMFSGAPMPEKLLSANAYLGAFPIAAALDAGADVVITGRCVDSAVTLGPLIHSFGWKRDDYDLLAAGTLAGHIIECGAQATGGNFTDWRDVADDWDDMGYPIAECSADGSFVITKPEGTGGLVSPLTVGEQVLYEIGDPAAYVMPDVVCDFRLAEMDQIGPNKVKVSGVKGRPPTDTYKVSATWVDGFRATMITTFTGFDAAEKARTCADKLVRRCEILMEKKGLAGFRKTATHLIGAQTLWGADAEEQAQDPRELVLQLDVHHNDRNAAELFSKEAAGTALSMATGRCMAGSAGRPKVMPVVAQFAFLCPKADVSISIDLDGSPIAFDSSNPGVPEEGVPEVPSLAEAQAEPDGAMIQVPLINLAVARSGDKGDKANIGVMARKAEYLPWIKAELSEEAVKNRFAHFTKGSVERFELPGMNALNFLLHESLDGGGTSSLHLDSQAKTYAQVLLAHPISVPVDLLTGE